MKLSLLILLILMLALATITYIHNIDDDVERSLKADFNSHIDSAGISQKILSDFKFKWIELQNVVQMNLDTNKNTNEYLVEYLTNGENAEYWDVYQVRDNGDISNLYHEEKFYEDPDFKIVRLNDFPFMMKTSSNGSGLFLNCEIFKFDSSKNLIKVFQIPEEISTFQGGYYIKNNEVLFSLAGKKFKLALNNGIPELLPFTKRLQITDFNNGKHLLTVDAENDHLIVYFDGKIIDFINNGGETFESTDTIHFNLKDTCWIDDNSIIPTGIRYFEYDGFQFNDDLFPNFTFTQNGHQTFEFFHGYNGRYVLNFVINK